MACGSGCLRAFLLMIGPGLEHFRQPVRPGEHICCSGPPLQGDRPASDRPCRPCSISPPITTQAIECRCHVGHRNLALLKSRRQCCGGTIPTPNTPSITPSCASSSARGWPLWTDSGWMPARGIGVTWNGVPQRTSVETVKISRKTKCDQSGPQI